LGKKAEQEAAEKGLRTPGKNAKKCAKRETKKRRRKGKSRQSGFRGNGGKRVKKKRKRYSEEEHGKDWGCGKEEGTEQRGGEKKVEVEFDGVRKSRRRQRNTGGKRKQKGVNPLLPWAQG